MNSDDTITVAEGVCMTYRDEKETGIIRRTEIDESLLVRLKKDDAEAFGLLYEQASSAVFGYAYTILKNYDDAKDVMQETFLKIRAAAHLYEPQGKPMAWIMTIARNLCNMKFRQNVRMAETEDSGLDYLGEAVMPEDVELRVTLETAMKVLSDSEREVIILQALTGMKHREIAKLLKMPLATVLAKYHRGLKKMRVSLEETGNE